MILNRYKTANGERRKAKKKPRLWRWVSYPKRCKSPWRCVDTVWTKCKRHPIAIINVRGYRFLRTVQKALLLRHLPVTKRVPAQCCYAFLVRCSVSTIELMSPCFNNKVEIREARIFGFSSLACLAKHRRILYWPSNSC